MDLNNPPGLVHRTASSGVQCCAKIARQKMDVRTLQLIKLRWPLFDIPLLEAHLVLYGDQLADIKTSARCGRRTRDISRDLACSAIRNFTGDPEMRRHHVLDIGMAIDRVEK